MADGSGCDFVGFGEWVDAKREGYMYVYDRESSALYSLSTEQPAIVRPSQRVNYPNQVQGLEQPLPQPRAPSSPGEHWHATWTDWLDQNASQGVRRYVPSSVDDVVRAVKGERKLRSVGACHADNRVGRPDDGTVMIDPKRLCGLSPVRKRPTARWCTSGLWEIRGASTYEALPKTAAQWKQTLAAVRHWEALICPYASKHGTHLAVVTRRNRNQGPRRRPRPRAGPADRTQNMMPSVPPS
jgi:hypothetical protein